MQRSTLTIERYCYGLDPDIDLDAFRSTMEAAIESGGRFVDVPTPGTAELSVFIGPGLPIVIRTDEVPDSEEIHAGPVAQYSEFDCEIGNLFV